MHIFFSSAYEYSCRADAGAAMLLCERPRVLSLCGYYSCATFVKTTEEDELVGILSLFVTAFLIGLTGAMIPGPMTSVAVHHGVGLGWIAGPAMVSGHALLEAVMVIAIAFGAARFLTEPMFTGLIGIVGGLVLIYMGVGIVRSAGNVQMTEPDQTAQGERNGKPTSALAAAVAAGVTTSVSNPSWPIWWGTVGAGHVTLALSAFGAAGVAAFYAGHILSDLAWYTAITTAVATGGKRLSSRVMGTVLRILGVFMIVIACHFIWSGIQMIR